MALPKTFLFFLGTFALASLAVWIAKMFMDRHAPEDAVPEPELPALPSYIDPEDAPMLIREAEVSSISLWAHLLERFDFVERMKTNINQADLSWTVGRLTLAMLLAATISAALLGNIGWFPAWALLLVAVFIGAQPYMYILKRKEKRLVQIEELFPEAVDSMARALRAGYPFAAALDTVAAQTPNPLGRELRKTFAEGALGLPWEKALENLAERLPAQEVAIFTAAVQIQSRAGGNLSEVLDKLSEQMRESAALKGEVRSLSAQGRFAGVILTILPIAITGMLFFVSPGYLVPLFQDATGKTLLVCCGIGLVAAHVVIRKLVDIQL